MENMDKDEIVKAEMFKDEMERIIKKIKDEESKIKDMEDEEKILELKKVIHRDKMALIQKHFKLVVSIAVEYVRKSSLGLAQLIQEGNLGLSKAVQEFEPKRDGSFYPYVAQWIRQSIEEAVKNSNNPVNNPGE